MISQRQLDANRRNAQLSTGPRTPEGRAAVRSNALRHGLTAKIAVLDNENPEHFQEMLDAFQAEHQPVGPTEDLLVHQMVMSAWRLQRLRAIETSLFNLRMRALKPDMERELSKITETERLAFVFRDDTRNSGAFANLSRYETRIERSFYKALRELQHLQATRPPEPDPDTSSPDPPITQDVPPPAEPAPAAELPKSAKQTHSQDRTVGEVLRSGTVPVSSSAVSSRRAQPTPFAIPAPAVPLSDRISRCMVLTPLSVCPYSS
jgi:hypothetical protein